VICWFKKYSLLSIADTPRSPIIGQVS
jgi:hypothetical protein